MFFEFKPFYFVNLRSRFYESWESDKHSAIFLNLLPSFDHLNNPNKILSAWS